MKKLLLALLLFGKIHTFAYSQVVINEIFASNLNAYLDPETYNFPGYIEIYNSGTQVIYLNSYSLSDDIKNKYKWRFPAGLSIQPGGYITFLCDALNYNYHTNFKLDADGGRVILSNNGVIKDSLTYGKQHPNIVYGLKPDGSKNRTFLSRPTPGTSNNNIQSGAKFCTRATITPFAGAYNSAQTITINSVTQDGDVRYTTDGSEPTSNSLKYTGPFTITTTTVVKSKTFHSTYLPSETSCNTYLINEHKAGLPIVSVSTNPAYLFDDYMGIYVEGKNGVEGNCYGSANWNRDWDRPAVFEYFDKDGKLLLSQGTDIKLAGACSRSNAQKSLALLPSSRYGSGSFDYSFFASRPYLKGYGSLVLRNSGNDWNVTMFRDALTNELCSHMMDIDFQSYQPVELFLNGSYWGLMNLREKTDKNYLRASHGLLPDSVNMLERNSEIVTGTNVSYNAFIDSLGLVDMSTEAGYQFLDRNIDLNEYLNYLVIEIYIVNTDWPGNNIKYWKSLLPGAKWRWMLTDLDFGYGLFGAQPTDSTLNFVTATNGPGWPNPPWATYLPRKVFENPTARNLFIQKMETAIHTIFNETRFNAKVDSLANLISGEMIYHRQRFGGDESSWRYYINTLKNFNKSRIPFMEWYLKYFFKLYGNNQRIEFKPAIGGGVSYLFNSLNVTDSSGLNYITEAPIAIEAIPKPGYDFVKWECSNYNATTLDLISPKSMWKYFDAGGLNDNTWTQQVFDDNTWMEGMGELGYGDGDEKTTVNYGTDASNKYITTFFRKKFVCGDSSHLATLTGRILYDDGAVVYLNGKEVYRTNMPEGVITSTTTAINAKEDDDTYVIFNIPKSELLLGENILSVEIHQSSGGSSDISFDLGLTADFYTALESTNLFTSEFSGTYSNSMILRAVVRKSEKINHLVLNEVCTSNTQFYDNRGDLEDWIEIYNAGESSVQLSDVSLSILKEDTITWPLATTRADYILPGEFRLYFADDELDEGSNHLPFKLKPNGEVLKLIQPVGDHINILDSLVLDTKSAHPSMGRYPDGSNNWITLNEITPGSSNNNGTNGTEDHESDKILRLYPNPARDIINLFIQDEQIKSLDLSIFDCEGRRYLERKNSSPEISLDISALHPGTYLMRIQMKNEIIIRKFIKTR